jgi:hypothetical protein
MKIYFASRFDVMKMEVKIENDIGDFIVLQGEDCRDLVPYFGVKLDDGEQAKLTKWLGEHDL